MALDDRFPPLGLREAVAILLVIGAAVAAIAVEVTTSHPAKHLKGPVAKRLTAGRGAYDLDFPPHTTLAEARAIALRPFPKDARRIFYSVKAYCAIEVAVALLNAPRFPSRPAPNGSVCVELLGTPDAAAPFTQV